jgi:hypothetical protein
MPPDFIFGLIPCATIGIITLALVIVIQRQKQHQQAVARYIQSVAGNENTIDWIYGWDSGYQFFDPENPPPSSKWQPFMIGVQKDNLVLHDPKSNDFRMITQFKPDQVRWFGRPEKYHPGKNELWLHLEIENQWCILKLRMQRPDISNLVRALKVVLPPELVTAYRRHRPYIHYGPVMAQPAQQDIHGAWTLQPPIQLYLTPLWLVALQNSRVIDKIRLENIQDVGALRRLDRPDDNGLVRFNVEGKPKAFALADYQALAAQLAEAAKRTLEEPLLQKQKKKDEDEDEWE